MANQGAKKRKEENERHMKMLLRIILGSNAFFILIRLCFQFSSFGWRMWVALALTSTAYKLCYDQIRGMALPSYDENGELIDGGYDLSMGGLNGYLHDIIYLTAIIQLLSPLTNWAWVLYLLIPGFGLYKLWELVLYPYFTQTAPQEEVEDEKTKKKREKAEKKAARPKISRTRR